MKKEYTAPSIDIFEILSKPYCDLILSNMDLSHESADNDGWSDFV